MFVSSSVSLAAFGDLRSRMPFMTQCWLLAPDTIYVYSFDMYMDSMVYYRMVLVLYVCSQNICIL
jgi:hypothetical protein